MSPKITVAGLSSLLCCFASPALAQVTTSASGANAAAIQGSVDAFRTSLGTLNTNVVGSFDAGRREINWDGVPDNFASPNGLPTNFFNANSPRGVVFSTPGSGVQVSADSLNPTSTPVRFGNLNPSYSTQFTTFSPERLFAATGSNVVDVAFFVPGANTAARVRGFGAVFTDVDLANTTSIQFFGANNALLNTFFASVANNGLSFLGVDYGAALISRVRITSGNTALGPNEVGGVDVVAMDDFIFAEPIAATAAVPEPGTWTTMIAGFALLGWRTRMRRRLVPA